MLKIAKLQINLYYLEDYLPYIIGKNHRKTTQILIKTYYMINLLPKT